MKRLLCVSWSVNGQSSSRTQLSDVLLNKGRASIQTRNAC